MELDKFTKGFVDFIYKCYPAKEHFFIVSGNNTDYKFDYDNPNVMFFDSYKDFVKDKQVCSWAEESKLIILNGMFHNFKCFTIWPMRYLKKSYLMFWGGDLYSIGTRVGIKEVKHLYKKFLIKHAAGVINLVDGDYDELLARVNTKAKHFIAPMCDDGKSAEIKMKYANNPKTRSPFKILIGNSATQTNNHIEVFNWLSRFSNEDIQIVCPLSYGDMDYAEKVKEYGNVVFGDKFEPITSYMDKDAYFNMISDSSVSIFNNDRQQALGNIHALIGMKSKVFIRSDTCMWCYFSDEEQYHVFDCLKISDMTFEEFKTFSDTDAAENFDLYFSKDKVEVHREIWKKVFESAI